MFTKLRADPESEANTDNWRGGGGGRGQGSLVDTSSGGAEQLTVLISEYYAEEPPSTR